MQLTQQSTPEPRPPPHTGLWGCTPSQHAPQRPPRREGAVQRTLPRAGSLGPHGVCLPEKGSSTGMPCAGQPGTTQ